MADEEIAFAHEAVATSDTARLMARAMLRSAFGRRRLRVFLVAVTMGMTVLVFVSFAEDDLTTGTRLLSTAVWAGVFAVLLVGVLAALIYFGNRRNFGQAVAPGTVMRTGFGRDGFVTSNDLSSSRFSYRAVRSVDLVDGFVLIRYVGQPVIRVYPGELFPPEAVRRLRNAAVAA